MTPCAMLWAVLSSASVVRSSNASTVASRRAQSCLSAKSWRAITKRTLSEQPDFRQAVENNPLGFGAVDRIEDQFDGFPELEVRRIEQALLLIGIEQALRGLQLEHFDVGV